MVSFCPVWENEWIVSNAAEKPSFQSEQVLTTVCPNAISGMNKNKKKRRFIGGANVFSISMQNYYFFLNYANFGVFFARIVG